MAMQNTEQNHLNNSAKIHFNIVLSLALFAGCNNDEPPVNIEGEAIEQINAVSAVIDKTFTKTATIITPEQINSLRKKSADKGEFLLAMRRLIDNVFEDEVENQRLSLSLGTTKSSYSDVSVTNLTRLALKHDSPTLILSEYAATLKDSVAHKDHDKWVVMESFSEHTSASTHAFIELTASQMAALADDEEGVTDIITGVGQGGGTQNMQEAIELFRVKHNIPKITIALLLPAVQNYSAPQSGNKNYFEWLRSIVGINALNDRFINELYAVGYLGSLNYLISGEYDGRNENTAAVGLYRERYKAMMMYIFSTVWDN